MLTHEDSRNLFRPPAETLKVNVLRCAIEHMVARILLGHIHSIEAGRVELRSVDRDLSETMIVLADVKMLRLLREERGWQWSIDAIVKRLPGLLRKEPSRIAPTRDEERTEKRVVTEDLIVLRDKAIVLRDKANHLLRAIVIRILKPLARDGLHQSNMIEARHVGKTQAIELRVRAAAATKTKPK